MTLRSPCVVLASFATLTAACCGRQQAATPPAPSATTTGLYARPHVTIVAVTDWQAVLKPCGCTVDSQKGGIERIARAIGALRAEDDSVVVVHAGRLLAEDGPAHEAKRAQVARRLTTFQHAVDRLPLQVAAVSSADLAAGGDAVRAAYAGLGATLVACGGAPAVAGVAAGTLVRTKSGAVAGFLGIDPAVPEGERAAAVQQAAADLRRQGADVVVVLSNLGLRGARQLARAVPGLDAIVAGVLDPRAEPLADVEREGETLLIHATRQGAYYAALTLVPAASAAPPNPANPATRWTDAAEYLPGAASELQARLADLDTRLALWRHHATVATRLAVPVYEAERTALFGRVQRARAAAGKPPPDGALAAFRSVGLAWSAPVDAAVHALVQAYDADVAEMAESAVGAVPPVPAGGAGYVGAVVCLACHQAVRPFWEQDRHAHAWAALQTAAKTSDLDCVPCHVTGFGLPGGSALGKLEPLQNVQCEACHGPGSLHIATPGRAPLSRIVRSPPAVTCEGCHTPEHAPRFAFDAYRPRLLVPGHGGVPASTKP